MLCSLYHWDTVNSFAEVWACLILQKNVTASKTWHTKVKAALIHENYQLQSALSLCYFWWKLCIFLNILTLKYLYKCKAWSIICCSCWLRGVLLMQVYNSQHGLVQLLSPTSLLFCYFGFWVSPWIWSAWCTCTPEPISFLKSTLKVEKLRVTW